MPELKQLLADIVLTLVDHPDEVKIDEKEEGNTVVFTLYVNEADMGKVIGRRGKNAKCIRTVMKSAANLTGKKVVVDIAE